MNFGSQGAARLRGSIRRQCTVCKFMQGEENEHLPNYPNSDATAAFRQRSAAPSQGGQAKGP